MNLESIWIAPRLVIRVGFFALAAVVALACSACASKQKLASGLPAEVSLPSMTSTFEPSRSMGSAPSVMPMASANGSSFTR